jgi:hypothetical protein
MERHVASTSDGYRVAGPGVDVELANQFLAHLGSRAFSPATVRAYAYDLLKFLRFLEERRDAPPAPGTRDCTSSYARPRNSSVSDYDLIRSAVRKLRGTPVRLPGLAAAGGANGGPARGSLGGATRRGTGHDEPAGRPVRGLFEFAVTIGARADNPVPARRSSVPNRVAWLREEMLKTRVAHGYCSRQLAASVSRSS